MSGMNGKRIVDQQRRTTRTFFSIFVGLISLSWLAAAVDVLFELGWGWDRQDLWVLPLVLVFAAILRVFGNAIFKFVETEY
jgi:hypothetical protein